MPASLSPDDTRIVVIGGGTGSFVVLSGLKQRVKNLTALVNMSDDGGSSGVLRNELGVLPPGDVRQCLVALSESEELRDLFNYRFEEGSMKGHSFGNLTIAALEKMTGSFAEATRLAGKMLRTTGSVEAITLDKANLYAELSDGAVVEGEFRIGHMAFGSDRPRLYLDPVCRINPAATQAICDADMVVIAPGNLYGSVGPALLTEGLGEALRMSSAKVVYVCNLMTKPGQTDGFAVHDYVDEIERMAGGRCVDAVLYNNNLPEGPILDKYASKGEHPVIIDVASMQGRHYTGIGMDMLSNSPSFQKSAVDVVPRTLLRHDSAKLADEIMSLCA